MIETGSGKYTRRYYPSTTSIPSWSPDGKSIAIVAVSRTSLDEGGTNLKIIRHHERVPKAPPTTAESYRLARIALFLEKIGTWGQSPAGSPDGSEILFFTLGSPKKGSNPEELHVIRPDGRERRRIDQGPVETAEWSPDSNRIAAISRDNEGNRTIYTMSHDGSDKKVIARTTGQDIYAAEDLERQAPTATPSRR